MPQNLGEDQETSRIGVLVRNRCVQTTVLLWLFVSVSAVLLTHRGIPLNIPALNQMNPIFAVAFSSIAVVVLLAEMGAVLFLSRERPFPKLDLRAPERAVAKKDCTKDFALACSGCGRNKSPLPTQGRSGLRRKSQ